MWNSIRLQKASSASHSWQIGSDSEDDSISEQTSSFLPNIEQRQSVCAGRQTRNPSNASLMRAVLGAMRFKKRDSKTGVSSENETPVSSRRSKSPGSKRQAWSKSRQSEVRDNSSIGLQADESDILCHVSDGPLYLFKMAANGKVKEISTVCNANPERITSRDENGASLLHHAAANGKTRVMDYVLADQQGAKLIDFPDEGSATPLHWAVEKNNEEAVDYLVSRGCDPTILNDRGETPLHLSVRINALNALRALIKHKGVIDLNEEQGSTLNTPMHVAAEYDRNEAARLLLDGGAKLCKSCQQGYKPLHTAALNGSIKVMTLILDECEKHGYPKDRVLSFCDKELCSPLHCAVLGGDADAIKMCLENGARLDTMQADMTTPMHLVCAQGAYDIVENMFELAEEQAATCLSMQDKQGHTPLHKAAMYGHASIVEFLANHGADLNIVDADQNTPLLLAASRGNWVSVRDLIEMGADIFIKNKCNRSFLHMIVINGGDLKKLQSQKFKNQQFRESCKNILCKSEVQSLLVQPDNAGCTPLHYACQEGNLASLDTLMVLGVSARLKSSGNQSPLHFAAQYGRYNACKKLISSPQGPNIINEKDNLGMTPLHYAAENGHTKIVELLLNKGAVCHRNIRGESVLHVTATNGYTRTIKILVHMNKTLLDHVDENGNTALHHAGCASQVSTVKLLMDLNEKVQRNNEGHTFFTYAIQNQNREVALATVLHDRYEEAMQEFFKTKEAINVPSLMLIQHLPDVWQVALDRSITTADCSPKHRNYWVRYQFKYLQPNVNKREEIRAKMKEILETGQNSQNKVKTVNGKDVDPIDVTASAFVLPALNKMVQYNRVECLRHPVSTAYLQMKWNAYGRWFHGLNLFIYVLGLIPLTYLICTTDPGPTFHNEVSGNYTSRLDSPVQFTKVQLAMMVILTLLSLGQIIKEIVQMCQQRLKYFLDMTNLFEWVLYVSSILYVFPFYSGYPLHWQFEFGAIAVYLAWFNLLLFFQRFDIAGIYVVMFIVILRTLVKVLALFSFLIIAFTLSFYILMNHEADESFSTPPLAFMRVVTMTLGEISYLDNFLAPFVDGNDETLHYSIASMLLLGGFIIVMPILLMNLLIGLAVGDIAAVQSNAELQRLAMQVQLHTEIEGRLSTKILRIVDKDEQIIYPNRRCGLIGQIFGKLTAKQEGIHEEPISHITMTDRSINYLNVEVQKQKDRLKEMQITMNKQHDLLRLIVQKMEIRSEADEQDEGAHPDLQRRMQSGRGSRITAVRPKIAAATAFKSISK
uniref:transient receptor potential cation channel subfamily A member 1-like isoform X1 n=2 Tax=Styela clava TaxID=7725 RepID=UPI00193A7EA2|nr:transient receptor potential cation channel subfamily A member 1-like isoform X1 [Styela clava]